MAKKSNKRNSKIVGINDEFASCSVFLKEFKIGLRPILKYVRDGSLHPRMMGLFSKIKSLDRNSASGSFHVREGLKTIKGKMLLREFVFTPKAGIRQQFGNPQIDEEDFSVVWEDFDPSPTRFPKGATHFDFMYLVLAYDPDRNLFTTYTTGPIRRSKKDGQERLEMRPEKTIVRREGMQFILVAGIRFMEILGDEEYASGGQDGVGMEILGVVWD